MKYFNLGCVIAVLAFAVIASPGCKPPQDSAGLSPQKPAPGWTLKDLDGKDVSFAQFKGKVVVVDFWATWCGPCKVEIPGYIELQNKYGNDGLVIIGISIDQNGPAHVKKFVEKNGLNYPVLMADETIVAAFGDFTSIPTTFLINREGMIIHQKSGSWAHAEYEALVKKAL